MLFSIRKQKAALVIKYSLNIAGPAHVFCNPLVTMETEDRRTGQAIVFRLGRVRNVNNRR